MAFGTSHIKLRIKARTGQQQEKINKNLKNIKNDKKTIERNRKKEGINKKEKENEILININRMYLLNKAKKERQENKEAKRKKKQEGKKERKKTWSFKNTNGQN